MSNKVSPLAPASFPALPAIPGVRLAVAECGIRYKNRPDVLFVQLCEGTQAAGVFTQSLTAAAPVAWCRAALGNGSSRALVVNAGNANAFTGEQGMESVKHIAAAAAHIIGGVPEDVFICSTGVIGEPLDHGKISRALPELHAHLSETSWNMAARAIMTTDTFMKTATAEAHIGGVKVRINGFAKGSGMIAPNMATMLAFVFTDAAIPSHLLQDLLSEANRVSFNSITVDGDTSTNDTLLAFATGKAGNAAPASLSDVRPFREAFTALLTDLAVQIVKDGEGAQKLITVEVKGAENDNAAHAVAMTVANSPLVKTAIAGEDANWGRIVGAAGRAGEKLVAERLKVSIGGIVVAEHGRRAPDYDETPVVKHVKGRDVHILLELGIGGGSAKVYTCDLTHGYIDINGSYRS